MHQAPSNQTDDIDKSIVFDLKSQIMAIADRKARERAAREELIVEEAGTLLRQHGYLGLNLDELAGRIEYSKATIYNHFDSKEDLLAAVDHRHLQVRAELFSRALVFQGNSRERMFVVGWADRIVTAMFPQWSTLHQLMCTPSIEEKISKQRLRANERISKRCFEVSYEIIRQARAAGDLPPRVPSGAQIMSGLISLSKGAHLLEEGKDRLPAAAGLEPLEMLTQNYQFYLDGVGWKPLHAEHDYKATARRIRREVFRSELTELQQVN